MGTGYCELGDDNNPVNCVGVPFMPVGGSLYAGGNLYIPVCTPCAIEYVLKPLMITREMAEAANHAGICERCTNESRYVTVALGYERICHPCLTVITTEYTYVRFMAATGGTGNARLLKSA